MGLGYSSGRMGDNMRGSGAMTGSMGPGSFILVLEIGGKGSGGMEGE